MLHNWRTTSVLLLQSLLPTLLPVPPDFSGLGEELVFSSPWSLTYAHKGTHGWVRAVWMCVHVRVHATKRLAQQRQYLGKKTCFLVSGHPNLRSMAEEILVSELTKRGGKGDD